MKSIKNIKNILIISLMCVISLFFINVTFAANMATVNVETANLRETPDTDSKILILIGNNDEVELIEKDGEWYKVKYEGIIGYLREDLLTVSEQNVETVIPEEQETVETPSTETVTPEIPQTDLPTENQAVADIPTVGLGIQQTSNSVKLRIIPLINSIEILEIPSSSNITVLEILGDWIFVEFDGTKGWIRSNNIVSDNQSNENETQDVVNTTVTEEPEQNVSDTFEIKSMYVNSPSINVRGGASTTAEVITGAVLNQKVEVIGTEGDWSKVKIGEQEGYILSTLLSDEQQAVTSRSTTDQIDIENPISNTTSSLATQIVDAAYGKLGSAYVYGGSSPSGFDCSGLTAYIYGQYGITLSRTASGQYSNGVYVSKSELMPGDLVMFGPSVSGIYHVGIYIGDGNMIHAANSTRGVVIDTINSGYYYTNYIGARRVI